MDTYGEGEKIQVTITFDVPVTVIGSPHFEFSLGNTTTRLVQAMWDQTTNNSTALVFEYTVLSTDSDNNGIFLLSSSEPTNPIVLDTGERIAAVADNTVDANLDHGNRGALTNHKVDGSRRPPALNNAPTFDDGPSTTRSVDENTTSGQDIGAPVTASDADSSDTLTYALGGTDATSFSIVSSSGQLQTSAALDHETKSTYTVAVTVFRRQHRHRQH